MGGGGGGGGGMHIYMVLGGGGGEAPWVSLITAYALLRISNSETGRILSTM